MYEYICKVVLDNQEDEIKTYAYSTLEAFDNLVSMAGVTDIISVINKQTEESFTFDGDLMALKEARDSISHKSLITEELNKIDGTEKRNSLN